MNKNTAKDYLPLVQALADGRVIQYFPDESEGWIDCEDVNFMIDVTRFRIKPEPREIWVNEYFDGGFNVHTNKESAENSLKGGGITRRYREVIE